MEKVYFKIDSKSYFMVDLFEYDSSKCLILPFEKLVLLFISIFLDKSFSVILMTLNLCFLFDGFFLFFCFIELIL